MKYTWLFICLWFWAHTTIGYANDHPGEIKDAEFVIEKQKKNKINQIPKLFFKAPTHTLQKPHQPLVAIEHLRPDNATFHPAPETPITFFSPDHHLHATPFSHYCQAGISFMTLLYLDLALHNLSTLKGIWSAHIIHMPTLNDTNCREGLLSLQGKYQTKHGNYTPKIHYHHHWYTDNDRKARDERIIHQINMDVWMQKATALSTQDGKGIYHFLAYHHQKISEHLMHLEYKWVRQFGNIAINLTTDNHISYYQNDQMHEPRYLLAAAAIFSYSLPIHLQFDASLHMTYHNDPIDKDHTTTSNGNLYPNFTILHTGTAHAPYIGIGGIGVGEMARPLFLYKKIEKKPFIAKSTPLRHPHQCFKLYGGSKGKFMIKPHMAYHFNIAYEQYKNLSRMIPIQNATVYNLQYNAKEHTRLKATALVDYCIPNQTLTLSLKGVYCKYFENKLAPIWWYNKPTYKLSPALRYRPHPKLFLTSNLRFYGTTIVKNSNWESTNLGPIINLSLGGDYMINRQLTAFVKFSNLLNRKHTYYTNSKGQRFNMIGGLQYKW